MVDFKTYLIITLNVSVFNRHTYCFNNNSKLCALQQHAMASSVRHLVCIHFIYFFRKKGILSSKMQRNVAASNDQSTNRITRL